jgi:L-threonylcarbamoyladenylate synthase
LGDAVALILDGGPCAVGIESTILDLSGREARVLRPGMLDSEAMARVLGAPPVLGGTLEAPRVSGSLEAHYAPQTPLRVADSGSLDQLVRSALDAGKSIAVLAAQTPPLAHERLIWRRAATCPEQYAHDLYASLRELDAEGYDLILVAAPPEDHRWSAVADRLKRAAAGSK